MRRVEDPQEFDYSLERPIGEVGRPVSDRELEEDAQAFLAFAKAFGAVPPSPQALPSPPSAS